MKYIKASKINEIQQMPIRLTPQSMGVLNVISKLHEKELNNVKDFEFCLEKYSTMLN